MKHLTDRQLLKLLELSSNIVETLAAADDCLWYAIDAHRAPKGERWLRMGHHSADHFVWSQLFDRLELIEEARDMHNKLEAERDELTVRGYMLPFTYP